jgi:hypothetical protein
MRKLVSLGLFALMISIFSGSAFGGNVEECNFLKDKKLDGYVPGLYGICIAWHNASANGNENALINLEEKFAKKGGGTIPGSGGGGDEGGDQWFECPCFAHLEPAHVCNLGNLFLNGLNKYDPETPDLDDVYQGIAIFLNGGIPVENFGVAADLSECSHTIGGTLISREPLNTLAEGYVCGFEIGVVAGLTETTFCDS